MVKSTKLSKHIRILVISTVAVIIVVGLLSLYLGQRSQNYSVRQSTKPGKYRCPVGIIDKLNWYEREITRLDRESDLFNETMESEEKKCLAQYCLNVADQKTCVIMCMKQVGTFQYAERVGVARETFQQYLDGMCK